MADPLKLDLDALIPRKGLVTLDGVDYEVLPPKVGTVLEVIKLLNEFTELEKRQAESAPEEIEKIMQRFQNVLFPVMPALKDQQLDVSFEQAGKLLTFVFQMAQTPDSQVAKVENVEMPEKKTSTPSDGSEQSLTSLENTPATDSTPSTENTP